MKNKSYWHWIPAFVFAIISFVFLEYSLKHYTSINEMPIWIFLGLYTSAAISGVCAEKAPLLTDLIKKLFRRKK